MGLLTEYPLWFILLCLLLGVVYAWLLYVRTNKDGTNPWFLRFMAGFRFLSVSLISFLLLSPLIRQQITTIEDPVIIIGLDNSQSMVHGKDSNLIKGEFLDNLETLATELGENYDVRTYSFGEDLMSPMNVDFNDKLTNISHFFSEITNRYLNRNVGAVILVSDGIYNFGTDPYYTTQNFPYPLYTVALGDTTNHRDLTIRKVLYNPQIFLGDRFPIEIQVDASQCDGDRIKLTVKEKNRLIQSHDAPVIGNRFSRQIQVLLEANEPGWHKYSIGLSPLEGELSLDNNRQDIFIEVLDVRTKIVLVYDSPHPDIGAIRDALEGIEKYELIERTSESFSGSADSAALVIFYQVPGLHSTKISESVITQLPSALFVLGSQSDIPAFSRLNAGILITSPHSTYSEAYPIINQAFPYFTIDQSLSRLFLQYPPLQSPFGSYQYSPLTEVFAFQRINGITSRFPLICFTHTADLKRGFIIGENIWRWRLANHVQTGDHIAFDELIQKIVQYLSVRQDRSFFRVKLKPDFLENEPVEVEAELYNKSYELINGPDVSLVITDESGNTYPFHFGQTGSTYFLRAGTFPPGVYTYYSFATTGQDHYEKRGSFVVTPVNLEAVNLTANHNLLYRLAESHRGELLYPEELNKLPELIKQNQEIHSISYVQDIFSELINAPWVFLLILGFLTGEWVLRKYTGLR